MSNCFDTIKRHPALAIGLTVVTLGLPLLGYLGYRLVKWIAHTESFEKVSNCFKKYCCCLLPKQQSESNTRLNGKSEDEIDDIDTPAPEEETDSESAVDRSKEDSPPQNLLRTVTVLTPERTRSMPSPNPQSRIIQPSTDSTAPEPTTHRQNPVIIKIPAKPPKTSSRTRLPALDLMVRNPSTHSLPEPDSHTPSTTRQHDLDNLERQRDRDNLEAYEFCGGARYGGGGGADYEVHDQAEHLMKITHTFMHKSSPLKHRILKKILDRCDVYDYFWEVLDAYLSKDVFGHRLAQTFRDTYKIKCGVDYSIDSAKTRWHDLNQIFVQEFDK